MGFPSKLRNSAMTSDIMEPSRKCQSSSRESFKFANQLSRGNHAGIEEFGDIGLGIQRMSSSKPQ
jgi:hypothetical protein